MIRGIRHTHFSAYVIGVLLGAFGAFVVAPTVSSWDDIFWSAYDRWSPAAEFTAKRVTRMDGEIRATLHVRRFRGECEFIRAAAFQDFPGVPSVPVSAARADGTVPTNMPGGMELLAEWRFWPVVEGGRLRALMEYRCHGRYVVVEVKGLS